MHRTILRIYKKDNLGFINKDESYILEDIINIMKNFNPKDKSLETTIYAINSEINHKYSSNLYYFQSYVCKEILNNRSFIFTLENLRLSG